MEAAAIIPLEEQNCHRGYSVLFEVVAHIAEAFVREVYHLALRRNDDGGDELAPFALAVEGLDILLIRDCLARGGAVLAHGSEQLIEGAVVLQEGEAGEFVIL